MIKRPDADSVRQQHVWDIPRRCRDRPVRDERLTDRSHPFDNRIRYGWGIQLDVLHVVPYPCHANQVKPFFLILLRLRRMNQLFQPLLGGQNSGEIN